MTMKKKILYLSQAYPYPADGGGKIKTYQTLLALAEQFDVYAIFVSEYQPTQQEIQVLEKRGIKIKVFYSPAIHYSVKDDLWHLARQFLHGRPHYVFQYTLAEAFPFIDEAINSFQPNAIHIDHLNLAQYLPKQKNQTWILEHHNVEYYLLWTRFLHSRKWTRKAYLLIESILTYRFERRMLPQFDFIFAISEPEAQRVKKTFGIQTVAAQPLIYPIEPLVRRLAHTPMILFIGSVNWPPNEDAVEWFMKEMLPQVWQSIPTAEFHVVGKRNHKWEKEVVIPEGVSFHDYQKDLRPFLAKAHVFVLPFRMGGGVRIKSLTAMAAGIPVVATELGVEGLDIKHKRECLIAQTPKTFAKDVVNILKNRHLQQTLSRAGKKYVEQSHHPRVNQKFLKKYTSVIERSS